MPRSSLAGKKQVKFTIKADPDSEIYVAGSFNGWNPRKNKLAYKNGRYAISLLLPKGRHEYKFVINDVWCIDPECPEWAANGLGSLNSVVTVG